MITHIKKSFFSMKKPWHANGKKQKGLYQGMFINKNNPLVLALRKLLFIGKSGEKPGLDRDPCEKKRLKIS